MFNVLIHASGTAWETDQLMRIGRDRFKENSDSEAATIRVDRPETLKQLEDVPTLLMYENGAEGTNVNIVRYGFLRNIKATRDELLFTFAEEGRFMRKDVHQFSDRLGFNNFMLGHTHWAIKDAGIPRALMNRLIPSYDVVFSFAGEDRKFVRQVADYLTGKDVRVFYDEYEQVKLWGKNLADHFGMIYRRSAHYCVMFISEAYVRKMWTQHERQFAISRAMEERSEYILPARFDMSEVQGIPPTVHVVDLSDKKPAAFAKFILAKLGKPVKKAPRPRGSLA